MHLTIGSAPDSWGVWFADDARQTPWHRCLDEIAEAGYEWTELGPFGYLPTDPATLKQELDKRGLKVSGSFVEGDLPNPDTGWARIEKQLRGLGPILNQFDAKYLVLIQDCYTNLFTGEQFAPARLDEAAFARLVDTTERVGRIARDDYGLQLIFHPHAQTYVEHEDQIEKFLAATDPKLVSIVLDTGHHSYCGGDPVFFMKKHHARIPYLHLKSVDPVLRARVLSENIPFALAVGQGMFVEPSQGAVDFIAFRDVLRDIDYTGFGIVEQDMFPAPFDKPLPIAKRTRAYLREIGLG
ncbi:MAG: TIM barrel protein [Alphaproteobacteria bacterium]|nr:TIM barrel protein [Alphaproteobacteria bacterium]